MPVEPQRVLNPTHTHQVVSVEPGRTYTRTYDGVLIWAEVYPTRAAALAHRDRERAWVAWRIDVFERKGREVEHFRKWAFEVV